MSTPRSPRRRHSSRRYAVRRAGALVVVLLVAFGLFRGATALLSGGDDGVADADGTDTSDPVGVDSASPVANSIDATGGADTVGTEPEETQPVDTEPVNTGPASAANPATVFIVGDSDAGTFGPYLQTLLDGTGVVETQLDYKVSSGLARPDFFDWPAEIDRKLPEVNPDIVVATFGGNDAQGLAVAGGEFIVGDPVANEAEWTEEYQQRVGAVMDQLTEGGRTLIWVGIPNDDNPDVTARMSIQDQAAKAAAAERPEVIFIDTWKRFSGRDGGWAEFVIDPRDGEGKDVRADDGFHLNQTGAEILAIDIAQAIRDTLRAQGSAI
ncbi:MAG TPA: DUF459 domain-containing protein [Ilumatobacteraceae bacterium]|nr:DUF459 domain-containing protein [Ilumatobacteraceae bacterium]